jgi:tRNA pseudouridine32 synthase/23S rRNA pseudouridine746 synthase
MVTGAAGFTIVSREPGFLVVDKSPGLDFHDCQGAPGLCTLVGREIGAPVFPVHRLDKDTSGLIILPTDRSRARELAAQFRDRQVEKYYIALSDKPPGKKQGLVQGDMVRSRRGSWMLARSMERPARTRFVSVSVGPGLRLFVLKPLTGRTHQLRVALKSLGSPILGDRLYHPHVPDWPDRMYLHAHTLLFSLEGIAYRFEAGPRVGSLFLEERTRQILEGLGPLEKLPWPGK